MFACWLVSCFAEIRNSLKPANDFNLLLTGPTWGLTDKMARDVDHTNRNKSHDL